MPSYTNKTNDDIFTFEFEFCPDGMFRATRHILLSSEIPTINLRDQEWLGEDGLWSTNPGTGWDDLSIPGGLWFGYIMPIRANNLYTMQGYIGETPDGDPLENLTIDDLETGLLGGTIAFGCDMEVHLEIGEHAWRLGGPGYYRLTRTA